MAADSYDITIDQSADWHWTVRWLVGRNQKSAVPKDVTGYTAELVIAEDYNDASPLLTLNTSNSGATITPDAGAFMFHATHAQTSGLPVGRKVKYEINVTSPSNVVKRLVRGLVTVDPSVTP